MSALINSENNFNVLLKRDNNLTENDNFYIALPNNNIPYILIGDVIECIKKIPDKSINVAVTSPPYWNLRDYEVDGQIGTEDNPQEYVNKMIEVGNEILRVLKDDGAYFLNIGDTYIDKNLQMIPQRVAIGMQEKGWLLRNQLIWHKPDHMPSPVKSRFANTYEPIFFFTKNDWEKKVHFDLDAIRVPHKTSQLEFQFGKKNYNGKFKGQQNKNIGASPGGRISVNGEKYTIKRKTEIPQPIICDYLRYWRDKADLKNSDIAEYFGKSYKHTVGHWFRKDAGGSLPSIEDWKKLKELLKFDNKYDKAMIETIEVLQAVRNHPKGKNPGDLLVINTAKTNYAHFAVFPEEIPELAIKSCCPSDGIVLDPFAGSGTTGLVAKELNRKSILIELQLEFIKIMKQRCGRLEVLEL